ncbi:hypothetical protein [Streptomyces sp. TLI_146]|uniref:hypothetical protein n=1 Tax=Streptomyces sp. TLI_146 TaxID=1938858 RepID=UPI000CB26289|nr:hypothetical protein [Streptomyces sp. TLI_146]PKV82849.1 hypothetical protein BX283_0314 [Streptomyces sp. TLI_146]
MADSALWISSLTVGTGVLAGWVTSRGTARAPQVDWCYAPFRESVLAFAFAARTAVHDL